MSLQTFVGSFTGNNTTNNQSVTGVGFTPKILIFWWTFNTADASAVNYQFGMGAAVSSSSRFALWSIAADAAATSDAARIHDNTKCLIACLANGTVVGAADFVSMDSDGFTIDWTTATNTIFCFLALGGDDLTNASILQFIAPVSTGQVSYTGVGFQPTCILPFSGWNSNGTFPATGVANASFSMGAGLSGAIQVTAGAGVQDAVGASDSAYGQLTTEVIRTPTADPADIGAELISLDSDGFTLDWNDAIDADYVWVICLRGPIFAVGQFSQSINTGSVSTTGLGITPSVLMLFSANSATDTQSGQHAKFSFGAGTSSSARSCIWAGDVDEADPTQCDHNMDRSKIIKLMTAGTPTVNAAADLVSLDAGGFTLNWSTVDATARHIQYIAIGNATLSGGGGGGGGSEGGGSGPPGGGNPPPIMGGPGSNARGSAAQLWTERQRNVMALLRQRSRPR